MKKSLLIALSFAWLSAGNVNPETNWEYSQSTFQAFYLLETIEIDGNIAQSGDVIGAFFNNVCIGWVYADDQFTTVPLMGNDGGFPAYASSGDIPELRIYDASNESILSLNPGSDLPGWSNNEIFQVSGASSASNTFGCKDDTACNYDSDATADDGSCWSANDGCTCDDAQGSLADCLGECNGTAVVDDCDVCDGGNADKDCAGDCFGDALEDGCGVCDSDSSNDNNTCTGCTDACANNYDQANLFDDGSCEYTIPGVENLAATSGPARVILSWNASNLSDDCQANLSYEVYDTALSLVKETGNTTTQILGLEPGNEYCFSVLATNDNGDSSLSEEVCATPEIAGGISWGLQLTAGISGWGMFDEVDSFNYLGVAPNGSNDYDNGLDIPEPPMVSATNFISLHFTHEEWGNVFGNYFTQDVRLEDDEYFSENLVVWEADVLSNMSGAAYILIEHYNTPLSVPMYGEFDGEFFAIENGSMVEFFLQEAIPQRLTIYIGNIVPEAPGSLSASGGDRSISLDWDDDSGLYPATSYNVYRDNNLIANVTDSNYFDDEDMEGHVGQGLLYESSYNYTVTGINDAGESTKGHELSNHDGTSTYVYGRQSDDSATTDDNLDPIAIVANLDSQDGTNIDEGIYEIPHNFDIDANRINLSIDGSSSNDTDEFDQISSYTWSQVSGPSSLVLSGSDSDTVSFEVDNANGNSDKVYTLNLNVTADYPIKGGSATRASDAEISVTIQDEPNEAPIAPAPIDIIVGGDNSASYTMDDWIEDDGNDYDLGKSLWVVPHDGNPDSSEASLHFTANASSDPDDTAGESDELSYRWETGLDNEPFVDLNGDGTWSANEPYTDIDDDGEWDDGDVFYNGLNLNVLRFAGEYTFTLIVTDEYGASSSSEIVIGVEAEHNESPSAFAGNNQEWFMPNDLDLFGITVNDNSGSDNDNDSLSFDWGLDGYDSEGNSNGGWLDLVESLPVGDHLFTFTATDSYGASASDDVLISILNEPASAAITNLETEHGLYYVTISFNEGVLEEDSRYTGDLDNSVGYDIFRDGNLIATLDDNGDSSFSYLDNGIASSSTFNYDVQSFNSDERRGDAVAGSETTGDRPTVEVLSPNGAEIWSVGDAYPVEITTTDKQYISEIEVFYSQDGGQSWLSSGSIDSNSESTTIVSDGSEINYDALVKVVVTDVGDFNGDSRQSKEDASNNKFTLAAHTLSKNYWTGWHLFGAPLVPELQTMEDNLGILGNFGDSWIAYDQDGAFQDLELPLGQGFYLALSQDSNIQLSGDPVISSDLSLADLELDKGWTLAANPIVNIVDKNTLEVVYEGESKSYGDAVLAGWIAPHVIGWFEDTHYPADHLVPFGGYWFHTSRALTVKVRPHLPLESSARIADNAFSINLSAQPADGLSGGDFVKMSVKDGANDSFKYGEDEFDHPNPAMSSFVDLYFNKDAWIGSIDENGVMVDNPYFSHDVRSSDIENHVWNIAGKAYNVTGDINLSWLMSDIDQEAYLIKGEDVYDMREVSSIIVSSINDIIVVMGDLEAYLAPSEFGLSASYPNPFNPTTSMNLSLNESGYVSVNIYNVMGQIVSTLVDGNMEAGYHTLTWNADNMPSGMYLVRVQSGSNIETQKVMLLK